MGNKGVLSSAFNMSLGFNPVIVSHIVLFLFYDSPQKTRSTQSFILKFNH